jgi:hypothetical protein
LGGGFEFSPAIVVCKIDVLKFVPFFLCRWGRGKGKVLGGEVGVVCGYFSRGYCLCSIPDLTIGIQALEHGFLCKKICLGGYVFFIFPPAGVIHSCFRNWVWFLDTFWKTCGGVLFKSWTVFRSKLSGWQIMWSEIQLGTVAGFSFVQELLF